uniref:SFRICE_009116 n=1 Tax=Spodoptera frugiperda TaxID=7108 RepID=A0A2H1WBJ8_SPOFR
MDNGDNGKLRSDDSKLESPVAARLGNEGTPQRITVPSYLVLDLINLIDCTVGAVAGQLAAVQRRDRQRGRVQDLIISQHTQYDDITE